MAEFATGSHDWPVTEALTEFMKAGWADGERDVDPADFAPYTEARRKRLAAAFPGERIIVPSGRMIPRSNDQDYRFRPHSAYVWLTGDQTSDGVFVLEPSGEGVLYLRPKSNRSDGEFFTDRRYGELWAGRRPTLRESTTSLGLEVRHINELSLAGPARLLRGVDATVDADLPQRGDGRADLELSVVLSELRLVKDEWEVGQMRLACEVTARGFEDVVRALEFAKTGGGERYLEGTFWRRARTEGNDVGYHSIVAAGSHATTLHWIENNGPIRDGDLLLLDAGVELTSLYTADITRVLPISGRFTPLQRDVYELSRRANDAALETLKPGAEYRDFHRAAMRVMAHGLEDLGVLPVPAEQALDPESTIYRRWTLCGSGHMIGLDVHDCGRARATNYLDGRLEPGHVLTVEPGIYFQPDDLLIPEELRGMGFRIEEDLLITADGYEMLSHQLPRTASDVESWMADLVR
ncbi:aminopeptidase P family protein [Longispora albida]|uniref:aminopeptidase P family protein n=1 Tax=Longispora albida TaxID=203523 RepID=UPI000370455A|nr:aminopeptidase P family protein [Longispora albida]